MPIANLLSYDGTEDPNRQHLYLAYSGQHYDALVSPVRGTDTRVVDDATCLREFPDAFGMTSLKSANEGAVRFALAQREKTRKDLLTRKRKRLKCGGCGEILLDAKNFQSHCEEVEHDDDFAYDCTEIEVTEEVSDVTEN